MIGRALLAVAFVVACSARGTPTTSTVESDIDLSRCAAYRFKCPEVRGKCDRDWVTRRYAGGALRDPAWGPCQPPPPGGCIQVILGNFGSPAGLKIDESVKGYIGCPGYVVERQDKWTQYLNDRFMACAITGQLGATCDPPIKIVTPEDLIPEPGPGQRTTTREICQMMACGCDVKIVGKDVKVGACPKPKPGTTKPKTARVAIDDTTDDDCCVACASTDGAVADTDTGTCGTCATLQGPDCASDGVSCVTGADCCSGACSDGICDEPIDPPSCQDDGDSCMDGSDCCSGLCDDSSSTCTPSACAADAGAGCGSGSDAGSGSGSDAGSGSGSGCIGSSLATCQTSSAR